MSDQTARADAATWWTVPQAAAHLQVSENAVYAAIRAGQIPVLHVGTQPRINAAALGQWTLERVRRTQLGASDQIVDQVAYVQGASPTAAPTASVTDRLRPKHIKTAAWRVTES